MRILAYIILLITRLFYYLEEKIDSVNLERGKQLIANKQWFLDFQDELNKFSVKL